MIVDAGIVRGVPFADAGDEREYSSLWHRLGSNAGDDYALPSSVLFPRDLLDLLVREACRTAGPAPAVTHDVECEMSFAANSDHMLRHG